MLAVSGEAPPSWKLRAAASGMKQFHRETLGPPRLHLGASVLESALLTPAWRRDSQAAPPPPKMPVVWNSFRELLPCRNHIHGVKV